MNTIRILAMAAMAAMPAGAAMAQYPERPVSLVVPYSAGGGADGAARILAQRLSRSLGQQVLVENRPGAGGLIGAQYVAEAEPDGYTVLYDASAFVTNQVLRQTPFDAEAAFEPVSLAVIAPNILVTSPDAPFETIKDFVGYASENPDEVTFASAGSGTASHLAGESLNEAAGLEIVHVPYQGGAPAVNDVMGGQVSIYFANTAAAASQVTGGALRALAIGSPERSPILPDVPTLIESGFAGFETQEWNGVFVPSGTDPAIVERLAQQIQEAMQDPDTRRRLEGVGLVPVGNTPDEFRTFLNDDLVRTNEIVATRGITVD